MQKVVIYGDGKIAKVVYQYIDRTYEVVAFCVEKEHIEEENIDKIPVLEFETIEKYFKTSEVKMIIAVGYHKMNEVRENIYYKAKDKGYQFINYIHPSVEIFDSVEIGENNVILDQVSIQPDVKIGNSNFIWSGAVIAHGSMIKDSNWVASGSVISGDAELKSRCFLGVNATIGHNITIEDENFVGANTLVTKNTNAKEVFISKEGEQFRLDSKRFLRFTGV